MNPVHSRYSFRWLLPLACVAFGLGALRAADRPPGDDRMMFDDIKVNGQPVRLAFDTGSEVLALFRPVAERLGLKIYDPPADTVIDAGKTRLGRTDPLEIQVTYKASTKTVTSVLAVIDVPAGAIPDVDGVIGWAQLRNNFFVFDAASSKVEMNGSGKPPKPAAAWQPLSLQKNAKVLILDIPGSKDQPGAILIDTGMPNGVNLSPARWREWRAAHSTAPTTLEAYFTPGAAGLVVREVSWARELAIGPLKLTDVTVQEAGPVEDALIAGHEATLGIAALRRQDVVVDGKNGMAYFSRRQNPAAPLQHNRLGAIFVPSDMQHDPLEARVVAGSPADAAGIRNGDELLKIDELDTTKWRTDPALLPMSKFWQRPAGTKFVLTLKRGDKEFALTVTLRDILGPGAAQTKTGSPPLPPPKP
jgi:hypothetical protein